MMYKKFWCSELTAADKKILQTLRKAGGLLIMTVPKSFIEQNGLSESSQVELHLYGKKMTVEALT